MTLGDFYDFVIKSIRNADYEIFYFTDSIEIVIKFAIIFNNKTLIKSFNLKICPCKNKIAKDPSVEMKEIKRQFVSLKESNSNNGKNLFYCR